MFMAVTLESAVSMGKNFQNNRNSIVNTTDLTLKQMFDICARLDLRIGNTWLGRIIHGNICR